MSVGMWIRPGAVLFAGLLFTTHASAQKYEVGFSATVSGYQSVDKDFVAVDLPSLVKIGDTITIRARFDVRDFVVQPPFEADPSINVYYGSLYDTRYDIAGFAFGSPVGGADFSSMQLWDDRYVASSIPSVDSFSLTGLDDTAGCALPVFLGAGDISLTFSLMYFDFTATARTNDLISQITPLALFGNNSASFGFINRQTYLQTSYSLTDVRGWLSPVGVPEPASWLFLLIGFAGLGSAVRGRTLLEGSAA